MTAHYHYSFPHGRECVRTDCPPYVIDPHPSWCRPGAHAKECPMTMTDEIVYTLGSKVGAQQFWRDAKKVPWWLRIAWIRDHGFYADNIRIRSTPKYVVSRSEGRGRPGELLHLPVMVLGRDGQMPAAAATLCDFVVTSFEFTDDPSMGRMCPRCRRTAASKASSFYPDLPPAKELRHDEPRS